MKFGQRPLIPTLSKESDVLNFGKHKGKTVEWLLEHHPSYLVWLDDEKVAKVSQEIYNTAEQYAYEEYDLSNGDFWGVDQYGFMDEEPH